jgi:hypothetical protein
MAYAGTTATTPNPPQAISQPLTRGSTSTQSLAAGKRNVFLYSSSNLSTDMTAAGFFSDAQALGMRYGDIVLGVQFDASSVGSSMIAFMGAVGALSTAGAAALTTGSLFTSTRATSL